MLQKSDEDVTHSKLQILFQLPCLSVVTTWIAMVEFVKMKEKTKNLTRISVLDVHLM